MSTRCVISGHIARTALFWSGCLRKLVEDMEVSFALHLSDDATLLQQVVRDLGADRLAVVIEHDFKVFALKYVSMRELSPSGETDTHMPTRVVVPQGLCAPEALK